MESIEVPRLAESWVAGANAKAKPVMAAKRRAEKDFMVNTFVIYCFLRQQMNAMEWRSTKRFVFCSAESIEGPPFAVHATTNDEAIMIGDNRWSIGIGNLAHIRWIGKEENVRRFVPWLKPELQSRKSQPKKKLMGVLSKNQQTNEQSCAANLHQNSNIAQ